jgi:hypothetical protein
MRTTWPNSSGLSAKLQRFYGDDKAPLRPGGLVNRQAKEVFLEHCADRLVWCQSPRHIGELLAHLSMEKGAFGAASTGGNPHVARRGYSRPIRTLARHGRICSEPGLDKRPRHTQHVYGTTNALAAVAGVLGLRRRPVEGALASMSRAGSPRRSTGAICSGQVVTVGSP